MANIHLFLCRVAVQALTELYGLDLDLNIKKKSTEVIICPVLPRKTSARVVTGRVEEQ